MYSSRRIQMSRHSQTKQRRQRESEREGKGARDVMCELKHNGRSLLKRPRHNLESGGGDDVVE